MRPQVQRLLAFVAARRYVLWVLADQVLVSGANFAAGVLLARLLGLQAYGQYVLLYAVLLYANTFANSLINMPMLTLAPRAEGEARRRQMLLGAMLLQLALSLLAALLVLGLGSLAGQLLPRWQADGQALLALAAAILAFQMQDWLRRYCFVGRDGPRAFVQDLLAYGGQLLLLWLLHRAGLLSVGTALVCLALPFALAFMLGSWHAGLRPRWHDARQALAALWRTSRDYLLSTQLQWAGSQGVLFIGAATLGAKSAGALRAGQNIVGPVNILYQALDNLVVVRCAGLLRDRGVAAARHYLKQVLVFAGMPLVVFFVGVSMVGEPLMVLAYGPDYAGYGHVIAWQAAYMASQFLVRVQMYWLRVLDENQRVSLATLLAAVISVVLTGLLTPNMHEAGVLAGMFAGSLASLLVLMTGGRRRQEGES